MLSLQLGRHRLWLAPALLAVPAVLAAQAATITGHVKSDAGAPLLGVTVSIPGLGVGSTTRDDGQYTFTVPASRITGQSVTLNARRVGYAPQNASITLAAGTITHRARGFSSFFTNSASDDAPVAPSFTSDSTAAAERS